MCACKSLSAMYVLFATLWTVGSQVPLSMGFSGAGTLEWVDYGPPPGDLPGIRIEPVSYISCTADSLPPTPPGSHRISSFLLGYWPQIWNLRKKYVFPLVLKNFILFKTILKFFSLKFSLLFLALVIFSFLPSPCDFLSFFFWALLCSERVKGTLLLSESSISKGLHLRCKNMLGVM